MKTPRFFTAPRSEPGRGRIVRDLALLMLLTAAMVCLRAAAPSNTYSYAQFWQIRASLDHRQGGSWVLPMIDREGNPARKPQLYAWMLTGSMALAEAVGLDPTSDPVFRAPSILAAAISAVLVYLLGLRWFGRQAGLFAAGLWLTGLHMNKLIYLATTDMLLNVWLLACLFCVDRLTFHPARRRGRWLVGFWACMVAAGLAKGWGIVNFAVLGLFLALAGGLGPGFAAMRRVRRFRKVRLAVRLVGRRWWAVLRRIHLGWGLLVMGLVMVPLGYAMLQIGGQTFRDKLHFEVVQRVTGAGEHAPHASAIPGFVWLLYNTLPASIPATGAFLLVPWRRWLGRRSPLALPGWWIIAVLLAFGIPAGFRPDYLLPAYAGVALLAGWAITEADRRWDGPVGKHLRRIVQAIPFVVAAGLSAGAGLYLLRDRLPEDWADALPGPGTIEPATAWTLGVLLAGGAAGLFLATAGVRRRRLGLSVAALCIGMAGMAGLYSHLWSRQARTGDGEEMVRFAERIEPILGEEPFVTYCAKKLGTEVYLGRLVPALGGVPPKLFADLAESDARWLVVSDIGLLHAGAYTPDPQGAFKLTRTQDGKKVKQRFEPRPETLGRVAAKSDSPIEFESWGRLYLIELTGPPKPPSPPLETGYISDPVK